MRAFFNHNIVIFALLPLLCVAATAPATAQSKYGVNDTIITAAVVFEGDTIEAQTLPGIYVWGKERYTRSQRQQWDRLRNAVYVTYPYAVRAGIVFNDIERHIAKSKDKVYISRYINSKEKALKKEFADPLMNLSVYQGKVLMKLINRQTGGTNCYDILKEFKGGFSARFWQTVAFLFGSDLKQPYDPKGQDAQMEAIVKEVQKMYGYSG